MSQPIREYFENLFENIVIICVAVVCPKKIRKIGSKRIYNITQTQWPKDVEIVQKNKVYMYLLE